MTFNPDPDPVELIGPLLHHLAALATIFYGCRPVQGYPVQRELMLDPVRFVLQFLVQNHGNHRSVSAFSSRTIAAA